MQFTSQETPQLVFLKPAEVVPYPRYSEIRRQSALRTFSGLEKLVLLRLHRADLVDLAWEMFDGLDSLQVLSLEDNALAYVPDWSLYGAPKLRVLSLANNELLDLTATALVGLLELRLLDVSHNNISHLSELSLPPFPKLRRADFRGNPIDAIFPNTFQITNATETLQLGGAGVPLRLSADMFLGLYALRSLTATDVTVTALDRDILRGMPRLRSLTLRGEIPILPFDAFVEVPKLDRLVLRRCGIRTVSMDAFYGLNALRFLDLSDNMLRSLPYSVLEQHTGLLELVLTGNQLAELPPGFMDTLQPKLLRLDGNPWNCSCDMADWRPTSTNKVFQGGRYRYDQRVAPTCAFPERYSGWTVYDAMRRGFRCNKNPSVRVRPKPNAVPVEPAAQTQAPPQAPLTERSNRVLVENTVSEQTSSTSAPDAASTPADTSMSSTSTTEGDATSSSSTAQDSSSPSSASTEVGGRSTSLETTRTRTASSQAPRRRRPEGSVRMLKSGGCKVLHNGKWIFVPSRKACKAEHEKARKAAS